MFYHLLSVMFFIFQYVFTGLVTKSPDYIPLGPSSQSASCILDGMKCLMSLKFTETFINSSDDRTTKNSENSEREITGNNESLIGSDKDADKHVIDDTAVSTGENISSNTGGTLSITGGSSVVSEILPLMPKANTSGRKRGMIQKEFAEGDIEHNTPENKLIKSGMTNETGTKTDMTKETGTKADMDKETGTKTDMVKETGTKTDMTKETGTKTDMVKETGTKTDMVKETGTKTDMVKETGTKTDMVKETGTETDMTKETRTKTDMVKETGTKTDMTKETKTKTDMVKEETKTKTDMVKETGTKRYMVKETGTKTDMAKETGIKKGMVKETGTKTDMVKETGTKTDMVKETRTKTDMTKETGTKSDMVKETGTKTDMTNETGTKTDMVKETGTKTDMDKETGTKTDMVKETGTETDMTKETRTKTDMVKETGTKTDITKETRTKTDMVKETGTKRYMVKETGTKTDMVKETGTKTDMAKETGIKKGMVKETGTKTDMVKETGTKTDMAKETGTKTDMTKETRTKTDMVKETGTKTDMTKETRTKTDMTKETRTKTDMVKETGTKTDMTKETRTKTDMVKETGTKRYMVKEAGTKTDMVKETGTKTDMVKETATKTDMVKETATKTDMVKETATKTDMVKETGNKTDMAKETGTKGYMVKETRTKTDMVKEKGTKIDMVKETGTKTDMAKETGTKTCMVKEIGTQIDITKETGTKRYMVKETRTKRYMVKETGIKTDTKDIRNISGIHIERGSKTQMHTIKTIGRDLLGKETIEDSIHAQGGSEQVPDHSTVSWDKDDGTMEAEGTEETPLWGRVKSAPAETTSTDNVKNYYVIHKFNELLISSIGDEQINAGSHADKTDHVSPVFTDTPDNVYLDESSVEENISEIPGEQDISKNVCEATTVEIAAKSNMDVCITMLTTAEPSTSLSLGNLEKIKNEPTTQWELIQRDSAEHAATCTASSNVLPQSSLSNNDDDATYMFDMGNATEDDDHDTEMLDMGNATEDDDHDTEMLDMGAYDNVDAKDKDYDYTTNADANELSDTHIPTSPCVSMSEDTTKEPLVKKMKPLHETPSIMSIKRRMKTLDYPMTLVKKYQGAPPEVLSHEPTTNNYTGGTASSMKQRIQLDESTISATSSTNQEISKSSKHKTIGTYGALTSNSGPRVPVLSQDVIPGVSPGVSNKDDTKPKPKKAKPVKIMLPPGYSLDMLRNMPMKVSVLSKKEAKRKLITTHPRDSPTTPSVTPTEHNSWNQNIIPAYRQTFNQSLNYTRTISTSEYMTMHHNQQPQNLPRQVPLQELVLQNTHVPQTHIQPTIVPQTHLIQTSVPQSFPQTQLSRAHIPQPLVPIPSPHILHRDSQSHYHPQQISGAPHSMYITNSSVQQPVYYHPEASSSHSIHEELLSQRPSLMTPVYQELPPETYHPPQTQRFVTAQTTGSVVDPDMLDELEKERIMQVDGPADDPKSSQKSKKYVQVTQPTTSTSTGNGNLPSVSSSISKPAKTSSARRSTRVRIAPTEHVPVETQ